jgi:hypothetical protein
MRRREEQEREIDLDPRVAASRTRRLRRGLPGRLRGRQTGPDPARKRLGLHRATSLRREDASPDTADPAPYSRGMKRHPALIPLSRDHHNGLVQAVRLRRAAADGDASARLAAAREFEEFFRNEERVHLRDEEEELFPLLLRHVPSQPALLREARVQHVQLQGFARKLDIAAAAGSVDRETLDAAGALLDAHIRLRSDGSFR